MFEHVLTDVITNVNNALGVIIKNNSFSKEEKNSLQASVNMLNGIKTAIVKSASGPRPIPPSPMCPPPGYNGPQQGYMYHPGMQPFSPMYSPYQQQACTQKCKGDKTSKSTKASIKLKLMAEEYHKAADEITIFNSNNPKERQVTQVILSKIKYFNELGTTEIFNVEFTGNQATLMALLEAIDLYKPNI